MNTSTIKTTFLDFYLQRGHKPTGHCSLIPPRPDDPVLFVTSGMHPLIDFLQGQPHPQGPRLVNSQRCLRTSDLDEVGDETHLTMFEMLGSWSLGDYDHSQSLRWSADLLQLYGIDRSQLWVTVFGGDDRCQLDVLSLQTWQSLGFENQITLTTSDNWWNGPDGMCGPDSEIFFWSGQGPPVGDPVSDNRWVEIWNHVSMTYQDNGQELVPLPLACVDTGMGLERLSMVLQNKQSVYDIDTFDCWKKQTEHWMLSTACQRMVMDHMRSSTHMIDDGVVPGNTGRGYVLRRLLRKTLNIMWQHGLHGFEDFNDQCFIETLSDIDIHVLRQTLENEQQRFSKLLLQGRKQVKKKLKRGPLCTEDYVDLFQTHGLPREVVVDIVKELENNQ